MNIKKLEIVKTRHNHEGDDIDIRMYHDVECQIANVVSLNMEDAEKLAKAILTYKRRKNK